MVRLYYRLKDYVLNKTINRHRYHTDSESIILACYFNFKKNEYRKKAFFNWYETIKHLNHRIIECVLEGEETELGLGIAHQVISTKDILWHKESLLNILIKDLPAKYKYVYWCDTDIILTNQKWLTEGAEVLRTHKIIQPFSSSKHLSKTETNALKATLSDDELRNNISAKSLTALTLSKIKQKNVDQTYMLSFAYCHVVMKTSRSEIYTEHGHVGFIWGAQRSVLDEVGLFERGLVGGADHVMAHSATGDICHKCNKELFQDNIGDIMDWGSRFFSEVDGSIGFVNSGLYHLWHGDIKKRDYYNRIVGYNEQIKNITKKEGGLFVISDETDDYVSQYMDKREYIDEEIEEDTTADDVYDDVLINTGGAMLILAVGSVLDDETSVKHSEQAVVDYIDTIPDEINQVMVDDITIGS